jgi:LemA protein
MGIGMLPAVAIPIFAAAVGYCRLLTLRGRARAAWLPVEAGLAGRHERVRKLLDAVSESRGRDSELARALHAAWQTVLDAQGIPSRAAAENELSRLVGDLICSLNDTNAAQAPHTSSRSADLCAVDEETIRAVRCYNHQVMTWNRALHQWPGKLVARPCGFRPIEYFVLDEPSPSEARLNTGSSERMGTPIGPYRSNS